MSRYSDQTTTTIAGVEVPLPGVAIYVYDSTGALITLTADGGGALSNPFLSDGEGNYAFNVAQPGLYDLKYYYGSKLVRDRNGVPIGADVGALFKGDKGDRGPPGSGNVIGLSADAFLTEGDDPAHAAANNAGLVLLAAAINAASGGRVEFTPGGTYYFGGGVNQVLHNPAQFTYYTFPPTIQYPLEIHGCTRPVLINGNGARMKNAPGGMFGTFNIDRTVMASPPGYLGVGASTPYFAAICCHDNTGGGWIRDLEIDGNILNTTIGGPFSDTGIQLPMTGVLLQNNLPAINLLGRGSCHHHGEDGMSYDGPATSEGALDEQFRCEWDSHNNGRLNVSIVGGKGQTYTGRYWGSGKDAHGISSNPNSAFDCEAEGSKIIRDVLWDKASMWDNFGLCIVADSGTNVDRLTGRGCTFVGTTNYSLWLNRPGFRFERCLVVGTVTQMWSGTLTSGGSVFNPADAVRFKGCEFRSDAAFSPTGPVFLVNYALLEGGIKYVGFDDCEFVHNVAGSASNGNTDGARFHNCTFRVRQGSAAFYGHLTGKTTYIDDGGVNGALPGGVRSANDAGRSEDGFEYVSVVANVATTTAYSPSHDRQGNALGTRTTSFDGDLTLTPGTDKTIQIFTGALTVNRVLTLATTGVLVGAEFSIARTAASTGAFTLTVAGKALATGQWARVRFDGTSWNLVAAGSL